MTLATATVGDLVPPRERGRYQGYIQLTFLLASLAGPLLGRRVRRPALMALGVLRQRSDRPDRRWCCLSSYLHLPGRRGDVRIDYGGAALLAGGIVRDPAARHMGRQPVRLDLAPDPRADRWRGGAFGRVSVAGADAPEPVLPLRLFRDPVFVVVSARHCSSPRSRCSRRLCSSRCSCNSSRARARRIGAADAAAACRERDQHDCLRGRSWSRTGRYKLFPGDRAGR